EKLIDEWYENLENSEEDTAPILSEMSDEYKQILENRIWDKINPHPPAATRSEWYYPVRIAAGVVLLAASALLITRYINTNEPVQQVTQTSPGNIPSG